MDHRMAPSVQIEAAIEAVLTGGLGDPDALSTLGRLGAQLVLQRAVEDEVAVFLRRSRYERSPDAAGSRNGHRPKRVQTAEGEIIVAVPQVVGHPRHEGRHPDPAPGGARDRRVRPGPE